MRILAVIGHNFYPWQDIILALASAGAEVCWVKPDKLAVIAPSPFDAVLADHHAIPHLVKVELNCKTLMIVQMDSVFHEIPFIAWLLDQPHYSNIVKVVYWAVCRKSSAFVERYLPTLPCLYQRYPFQNQYSLSLPEGFLCPPAQIRDHLANTAAWLSTMTPGVDLSERTFFTGTYDNFSTPTAGWPGDGPFGTRDLDDLMRAPPAGGTEPPAKIDCMRALIEQGRLSYAGNAAAFNGYYRHIVKLQSVRERGPLVVRIGEALGDRFHLMGDDWAALNVPHVPSNFGTSVDTAAYYNRAKLSLDLGSSQLDTGWYQRPMEIIKYGGHLLQLKRFDSSEIFGPVADLVVCESADHMVARIEWTMGTSETGRSREDRRQAVARHLVRTFGSAAIGTKVLDWLPRLTSASASGTQPGSSIKDEIARGKAAIDAGDVEAAVSTAQAILATRPKEASAIHLLGLAAERVGQIGIAQDLLLLAATLDSRTAEFQNDLGRILLVLRRFDGAATRFRNTLSLSPDYPNAHVQLSMATLPGEPYYEILRRTHALIRPETYIEIGVMYGQSLALARPPTRAIGIDPVPEIQHPFEATTTIYPSTSDMFFDTVPLRDAIGSNQFEMAFIDGLHTFDQTLRDFINIERHAKENSVVFIHDCIPLDAPTSTRTQNTSFWSGDTWKIVPILKRYRPDLTMRVIATCPTGLGIITGLDPRSKTLDDRWADIVSEYMSLGFDYLDDDREEKLNIVPNDWPMIEKLLRDARG